MRIVDIINRIWNNSMKFDTSKVQVAFTKLDLETGSKKGFWPIMMEKAWAKVHGAYGNSVGG
jgi:hypothetical protein